MEKKHIAIDEDVWLKLHHLKLDYRARSISEVLRRILKVVEDRA